MFIDYEVETHPFNRNPELTRINGDTNSLIIGTFPPDQITHKRKKNNGDEEYRFYYYYGSSDNKFWDNFLNAFNVEIGKYDKKSALELIKNILDDNNIGIIDIIYKCRRKNGISSSDSDISIIELEDIYKILIDCPHINKIYFTSYFTYELFLSKILKPLYRDEIKKNEIYPPCENINKKIHELRICNDRDLFLFILPSPSPQAFRNPKSYGYNNEDKEEFLKSIYKSLLKYSPEKKFLK